MHKTGKISKPNFTAWFVLQGSIVAIHCHGFFDAAAKRYLHYAKPLADAAAKVRPHSWLVSALPYAWQYKIGECVSSKGRLLHYWLRKQAIASWITQELRTQGVTQVMVLGAGFDVQSLAFANDFPDVRFIEIDVASTLDFKQRSFADAGIDVPNTLEFLSGDLRDPLKNILSVSQLFDSTRKTLWIAEGLFMFIPEESVGRILSEIRGLSVAGGEVIFTSLPARYVGSSFSVMIQKIFLGREKSPILWAISQEKLEDFVDKQGVLHMQSVSYAELHKSYNGLKSDEKSHVGEDIHRVRMLE